MNNLLKLITLLQITREQPLTGWFIAGIKRSEVPTLAEHHYTATLIGWLLAQKIKDAGGKINERKIVLMLLIHDLNELFGGDISGPLNRKYPDLREYKNKIGHRAIQLLSSFMDSPTEKQIHVLWKEMEDGVSDESVVVKIVDQMDHQMYMEHYNYTTKTTPKERDYRPQFIQEHIYKLAERIGDQKTKKVMDDFLKEFDTNFFNHGYQGMKILMEH
ncbi:MAG: HD domain-containing protein [Patescibacteria group bacterium]